MLLAPLGSEAERSELSGRTWHRAVEPLCHKVFQVPSFLAAPGLLPDRLCGSRKLLGWDGHGMGWSGHPGKPFQCSARLHSLKTANPICSLYSHTVYSQTQKHHFLFPAKEKYPFAQLLTDRCRPATKRCDVMQGSCFQRKTSCDGLRRCQIAGLDFPELREDLSGGQTHAAASHGGGDTATQRRFLLFNNRFKGYK